MFLIRKRAYNSGRAFFINTQKKSKKVVEIFAYYDFS